MLPARFYVNNPMTGKLKFCTPIAKEFFSCYTENAMEDNAF